MKIFSILVALMAGTAFARKTVTVTDTVTQTPATKTVTSTVLTTHTRFFRSTSTVTATSTDVVSSTVTNTQSATVTNTQTTTVTNTQSATVTNTQTTTITDTQTTTVATTSTETDTTTVTTTTTTTPSPTFTSFIGSGNMVVFANGNHDGHVSKYGGWYTSSTPATYTGISMAPDNSMFTLTTSQGPCQILGSGTFNCTASNTNTIFGQTPDGNLTYQGSDVFGAANGPTSVPGTVIQDGPGMFTLNIEWQPVTS